MAADVQEQRRTDYLFDVGDSLVDDDSTIGMNGNTMDRLGIFPGDSVLVKGNQNKQTVLVCASNVVCKESKVRLNGGSHKNLAVIPGDVVGIHKLEDVSYGTKVWVAVLPPADSIEGIANGLLEDSLKAYFFEKRRPVHVGNTFIVHGNLHAIEFKVVAIELPSDRNQFLRYCIVGPDTVVLCRRAHHEFIIVYDLIPAANVQEQRRTDNLFDVDDSLVDDDSTIGMNGNTMDRLGIFPGDSVLVKGNQNKQTVLKCASDVVCKESKVRLNGGSHKNLAVIPGDVVGIHKLEDVSYGTKVWVAVLPPADSIEGIANGLLEDSLKAYFFEKRRPVHVGNTFIVHGNLHAIEFKVVAIELPSDRPGAQSTQVAHYCFVGPDTVVLCRRGYPEESPEEDEMKCMVAPWKTKEFAAHFADKVMCKRNPHEWFSSIGDSAHLLAQLVEQCISEASPPPFLFNDPEWRNLSQVARLLRNHLPMAQFEHSFIVTGERVGEGDEGEVGGVGADGQLPRLSEISKPHFFVFSGGWTMPRRIGHAVVYIIERSQDNSFSFTVCNSGQGLGYHPSRNDKKLCAMTFKGVPQDRLTSEFFVKWIADLEDKDQNKDAFGKLADAEISAVDVLYTILIPYLTHSKLTCVASSLEHAVSLEQSGHFEKPQADNTCFHRSWLCALRYLLKRHGYSVHQQKQLFCLMRLRWLQNIQLKLPRFTGRFFLSDALSVQHAIKQTRRAVSKLYIAVRTDPTLDRGLVGTFLNHASSICCAVSNDVDKMMSSRVCWPLIDGVHNIALPPPSQQPDCPVSPDFDFEGLDLLFQDCRRLITSKPSARAPAPAAFFEEDLYPDPSVAVGFAAPSDYDAVECILTTALDLCKKLLLFSRTKSRNIIRTMAVIQSTFYEQLNPERWGPTLERGAEVDVCKQMRYLALIERLASIYVLSGIQLRSLSVSNFSDDDNVIVLSYMMVWFRHILGVKGSMGEHLLRASDTVRKSSQAASAPAHLRHGNIRCDSASKAHAWGLASTVLSKSRCFQLTEPTLDKGDFIIQDTHALFDMTDGFLHNLGDDIISTKDMTAPNAVGNFFCQPYNAAFTDYPSDLNHRQLQQLLLQCRSAQTKTLLDPLASFALFRNMNVLFMLMGLEIKSRSERQLEFQWSNFFENEHSVFGEISAQLPQPMRPESHSFKLSSKALNQIIGSSSMLSFAMVLKYFSGDNRILELGQPLSRRCFMFCLFTQGMFSSHCVDEKLGIPCDSLGSSLGRFLFEATEAPCVMLEDLLVVCSQLNQHIPGSGEEFGAVQKPVREALKFVLYVCVCFAKVLFKQRIKCEHVLQMPLLLEYIDQFSAFLFECAKPATVSIREKVHMFARSAFGSAVLLTTRSRDVSLDIVKRFFLASAYVLFWHDVKTDHGDGCEDEIEEYHQAVCDVIGEHVAIGSQLRVFVDALRNANQLDGTLDGIIDILGSENDEMQATKKWEYDEFASFVFKKDGSCVDLQTFDVSCSVIVVPPAVREKTLRLLSPLDADRLHATCKVSSVLGHTRYELSLSNDTKKLDKPLKLHFWNWNKAQDTNILKIPEFTEYLRNLDYEELHRSMFCTLFSIHKPLCEFFTRSFFSRMDSYFSKTFQSGAVSVICHSVIGIFFSAFEIVFFPNMNAADGRAFPLLLVYEWFAHVYPQSRDDGDDDDGQELEHTHLRKRLVFSNSKAFTWRKHVDMDGGVFPSPERDFLSAEFSTSESYTNSSAANESIVCDRGFLVASTDLEGFVPSCLLQKRQYWLTDSKIVSSPVNSDVFGTIEIEKGTASKSVTVASITDCCVLFLVNIVSPMISQRMGTLTRIFSAIEEMNHVLFWSRSCTSAVPCRIQLPRLQLTFNNIDGKFVIVIQEELALVESNAELTHILPRHLHPFMSTSLLLTNAVHDLFLLVPCSFVSATRLNVTGHLFNTDMDNIIVAARATSPFIVYRLNRFGLGLSNTLPLSPAALYASLLHCIFRTHEEADRLADDQKLSSTNGSSSFLDPSSQIKSTLFSHEELVSSLNKLAHDPGGRWVESDRLLLEIMKKFSSSQNDHHTHEISASILHQEPHKSVKAGDTVHERSSPVAASVICSPHEEFPPSLSQLQQVQSLFDKGQRLYGEQRFSDAAKSFEQAVEMKHVHSHALLSSLLIEGRPDVPKDTKRAFELALAGTALGCAHSKGALGRCYMGGFGVAEDHAKAYALGIESAAAGSCIGQHVVGVAYDNGYGVEQDKAEAVRWWRLAAVQGYAVAQVNLGFMFIHGYGVAQDKVEAVRWLRLAAAQGHAGAQFKLGFMFANGFGVAQDKAEAVRWLRLAAVQLCAPAQYNLGVMFANGDGVAQDKAEAVRWYRLAAAQGDASAQFKLGFMFAYGDGVAQDKAEAVRWYRLAAAQGVARAQFRLGEMLDDGVVDAAPPTSAAVLWGVPGILEGIHGKEIEFWSQAEEAIFQDVPAKADIFDVIVECFSAETSFTPHPTLFLLRGLCTPLESHGSMTQMRYMIIVAMSLVRCGPMTSKRLTALCSGEGKYRFTLVRLAAAFFMFSLFTRRGHRTLSLDEDSNVSAETVLKRLQEFVDDCTKQQIAAIHPLQQSSSYNGAIFDAACLDLFVHVPASNLCVQQVQRDQCSANEWLHRRNTAKWTLFATPDLMKWSSQFDGDVQHFPALPDFDAVRALSPDSVLLQSAHDRFAKCLLENKRHEEQRLRFLVQQFMLFVNAFSEVNFDEICGNIDIACGNRRAFQFQDLVQMLIYRPRRCLLHCAFSHVQASLVSLMCAMCRVDLLSSCAQSLLQAPAADSSALTRVVDQLDNPRPLHFSRLKDTEDLIPRAGPGCVCHRDVTRVCECRHIQQPSVADVHLLAFEFANNIMIRRDQLDMVDAILSQCDNGQHAIVHQAIMGCGKTSVICPLLALKLSDRTPSRLVVVVCPPNLLLQTSNQLREKLCLAFRKGVNTFVFDRQDANEPGFIESACSLVDNTLHSHSILCTTPSSIKCVFLKLNEILLQLDGSAPGKKELRERASHLQHMLRMFRDSIAIFDEVDVILHPLKSELTFAFEKAWIGDEHRHKYLVPEFLIHGVFCMESCFDKYQTCVIPPDIRDFFATIQTRYTKAIRNQEFIDSKFYFQNQNDLKAQGHSIKWWVSRLLLCYLRCQRLLPDSDGRKDPHGVIADAIFGATDDETFLHLEKNLQEPVRVCAKWCQDLLPHVISKHHRYHYGLLSEVDGQDNERMLKAVPFVGKDMPSPDSEFSNLDVTFGFTILSYMKEDLREMDVKQLVLYMQNRLHGKDRMQVLEMWQQWSSECGQNHSNLELLDVEMRDALFVLHKSLMQLPGVKRYYMQSIVLPKIAVYSPKSLSVGASDMCNMFSQVIGFSGTPSKDLYPARWWPDNPSKLVRFNSGNEAKIARCLTSSEHVVKVAYIDDDAKGMTAFDKEWTVRELLEKVTQSNAPRVSCLVDCGALITGFTNLEVAKFFMDDKSDSMKSCGFDSAFSACIFWDESDAPMAFERGGATAVPLASCSVSMDKWFVYFDQVHTTGIDIKLPREAVAVVTIGSDTILRDYVQACWRLRQFGQGQKVEVLLVPEIRRLVTKYTADRLDPGFTPKAGDEITDDAPTLVQQMKEQEELIQRFQLLNQELCVSRRRRMQQMTESTALFERMDMCFFQRHGENGLAEAFPQPEGFVMTGDEEKILIDVKKKLHSLPLARKSSSNLEAQSVRQRQQEKQKELATETVHDKQKDPEVVTWKLSDLIADSQPNAEFFHCISTTFSDLLGFYPDFMFASATFIAALLHRSMNYILPNVEAIVEVFQAADENAHSHIVFITLKEADTICRLLRTTPHLRQRILLYIIDSNGYCSDTIPCCEHSARCLDGHVYQLACSPPHDLERIIDKPSCLYQGLAFARLFNCNTMYDVFQTTFILHGLHQWHSKQESGTVRMRKAVSDSFTELSRLRQNQSDFKSSPFLMAATHDGLFVQRDAMQRWCSATKVMLQVARRIGASASSRRGMAGNEGHDVEVEANQVIQEAPDLTEAAMRKRDMFDVVFQLMDTQSNESASDEFFQGNAPQPSMRTLRLAASFVEPNAVLAILETRK